MERVNLPLLGVLLIFGLMLYSASGPAITKFLAERQWPREPGPIPEEEIRIKSRLARCNAISFPLCVWIGVTIPYPTNYLVNIFMYPALAVLSWHLQVRLARKQDDTRR